MLFPPELNAALGSASPSQVPADPPPDIEYAETVEKGHGRIEMRRLALSREVVPHLQWPGAAQVCRIERTCERAGKTSRAVSYAVTSLPRVRAGPEELLALVREHWGVEKPPSLSPRCRLAQGCEPYPHRQRAAGRRGAPKRHAAARAFPAGSACRDP